MQGLFDFPPAPKLNVFGRLDPTQAAAGELRGQDLFSGKGRCANCPALPRSTDNSMHPLRAGRFFTPVLVGGAMMTADGTI